MRRALDLGGPVLCGLGALCLIATIAVEFDSTLARWLMGASAVLFVPGAYLTLASVRRRMPPR